MSFSSSVIYPRREGATFDMKYYIDVHMPIVEKGWKQCGLLKWDVVEFEEELGGIKSPYSVAAILTWKDEASMKASLTVPETKGIMDDVANFSSEKPLMIAGRLVSQTLADS